MRLRLLHAIQTVNPSSGGPVEGMRQLEAINGRLGHVTEAVTLDPPTAPWLDQVGLKVHALGPGITSYGFSRRYLDWLVEHALEYDCIIVDGVWGFHALATWMAIGRLQRSRKSDDCGTGNGSVTGGDGRRAKIPPYVVFTHGMLDPWFKRRYPLKHAKKWLYYPWGLYPVLRDAAGVFFTCERERLLARESFWLYDCNEIVVPFGTAGIPDPSKDYRPAFLAAHPTLEGKRNILFLGRIHPKKGPDILLRGLNRLVAEGFWDQATMRLVMAGPCDSPYAEKLRASLVGTELAGAVYWTGMLTGDQKWGAFQASEAFVLFSHQENFGIAVAESMSAGVPVLISHAVNISSEVAVDGAGLVDEDTAEGAFRLLRKWMVISENDRAEMSQQARITFENRYTARNFARHFLKNIYLILASENSLSERQAAERNAQLER